MEIMVRRGVRQNPYYSRDVFRSCLDRLSVDIHCWCVVARLFVARRWWLSMWRSVCKQANQHIRFSQFESSKVICH
ncbi:hypothetical protein E2C01_035745 [Portunus trituberculatus]|uniref:Uncharacterized protein n=1 Tax=Portunus trituberculatus TaxID=210409 RepID=A0A5B7F542_PORTR|nr:hypothetical protein [Portunus trituberculatus]